MAATKNTAKTTARKATAATATATKAASAATAVPARKVAAAKKAAAATAAKRFVVAELPAGADGHFACRTCGEVKPVRSFPTVDGAGVRGTECRACRDGRRA